MPSWRSIYLQAQVSVGRIWFLVGCWTEGSAPHWLQAQPVLSSVSTRASPQDSPQLAACFTAQRRDPASKNITILSNIIMEVISHCFCHILLVRTKSQAPPTLKGRRLIKGVNTRRQDHWGPSQNLCAIVIIRADEKALLTWQCSPIHHKQIVRLPGNLIQYIVSIFVYVTVLCLFYFLCIFIVLYKSSAAHM